MNKEQIFNDLGVDILTGIEMMNMLDLSPDEFASPQRFSKFQAVIDFIKQFPPDTQTFMVKKACYGKNVDKLNHLFEYTNLLKQKHEYENQLKAAEREWSVVETDPIKSFEVEKRKLDISDRLNFTVKEIGIYEK